MKRYLSPKEYMKIIGKLAQKIQKEDYKPDAVLAILNGGKYPATFISNYFEIPMFEIRIKSYKGQNQGNIVVYGKVPEDLAKYRNVLVVDDLVDSGKTIKEAKHLLEKYPGITTRIATLFLKPSSSEIPDFYVEVDNKWIVFPYEVSILGIFFKFYFDMNERKFMDKFKKQ